MRILALAAVAAIALPASVAQAQYYGGRYVDRNYSEYQRDVRQAMRECRRDLRRADSRREYNRERRDCRRDLREARRDYQRDMRNGRAAYYNRSYYGGRYGSGYNMPRRYWDGYRWIYRY